MANTLKVTLVKSPIGAVPKHKKICNRLWGLPKCTKQLKCLTMLLQEE